MPILNWLNKEEAVVTAKKSAYRLLQEVPELSYGTPDNENLLIQGDNLEALKALIPFYAGKVKCIFIDPPYNTKSAFEHYDDNLEHSTWLSMMYPRLELLRELLSEDGSIWVTIDDNESHYLKVVCDEVFGRKNFISNAVWEKKFSPQNDAKWLSDNHDHVLVFAKNKQLWFPNLLPRSSKQQSNIKNPDDDPRGSWISADYTCAKSADERPNLYYPITNPNTGEDIFPSKTRVWAYDRSATEANIASNLLYWGKTGKNKVPRLKKFPDKMRQGTVAITVWRNDEVGNTQEAKREVKAFNSNDPFATPKPERLIERILTLASQPGDLILDSFAGSGTTAAVAHKMKRKAIAIEIGDQAQTHLHPRWKAVVDGIDKAGVSTNNEWQGGGGFRFYQLGECVFDECGCLNPDIKFPTLASHLWYLETKSPLGIVPSTPLLGVHNDTAYYLLYNGILGDRRPAGGNVLTSKVLKELPDIDSPSRIVIYGESSRLGEARLKQSNITFKQIPYDVGAL